MWYKNLSTAFFRFVTMHAFARQTDGQTDRQTEFPSLYRDCIPCSAVKNGISLIDGWIIEDIARLGHAILGGGPLCPTVLTGAWIQLHQTFRGYGDHSYTKVRISCCIFKRGRFKVEWCWKRRQILHFWPLWKLGEGWARSLYQLLKLYQPWNPRNTF